MSRCQEYLNAGNDFLIAIQNHQLGTGRGPDRGQTALGRLIGVPVEFHGVNGVENLPLLGVNLLAGEAVVVLAVIPVQVGADDEVDILRLQTMFFQHLEQVHLGGHIGLYMAVVFLDDLQILGAGVHQDVLPIALYQEGKVR